MKNKKILKANNDLLTAIANSLNIETEVIPDSERSIGGGGISRPTKKQ